MKPTVGLTSFFRKINLCEKKPVSVNVHGRSVFFKKAGIWEGAKKLFSLQRKWRGFLHVIASPKSGRGLPHSMTLPRRLGARQFPPANC